MVIPSKSDITNKENFRLLDLSTDDDSEDLHLEVIPSRKKKISRRERTRGALKTPDPHLRAEVQCALRWAFRGTLVLWLVMLTWICGSLYNQMSILSVQLDKDSVCPGQCYECASKRHSGKAMCNNKLSHVLKKQNKKKRLGQEHPKPKS